MVPFLTRLKKGGSHLGYGLSMAMIPTIFRCPTTGLKVQGLFADESPADASESIFDSVRCAACNGTHLINRSTGKILGASDE